MEQEVQVNTKSADTDFEGLCCIVTGGASGIGKSAAHTLFHMGARVAVFDVNPFDAPDSRGSRVDGPTPLYIRCDVTSRDELLTAVNQVLEEFAGLDVLINSAGTPAGGPLSSISSRKWRKAFKVNVDAVLTLSQICFRHLQQSSRAAILNIASVAAGVAYPGGGAYGPSKAALVSLSQQLAVEWASHGIRVNTLSPGTTLTPLTESALSDDVLKRRERRIPLGRLASPQEIADAAVFLVSSRARYVTGENLVVDGGLMQSVIGSG